MPGYTSNYGFPYPLTGDPIYLGATQQKNMADSIDAALWAAGVPVVAQTNPPRCSAVRSTPQLIPNTTDTLITFPTKAYDSEFVRTGTAMFTAGGSTITIRVAGIYHVDCHIYKVSSGGVWNGRVLYNGTTASQTFITDDEAGTKDQIVMNGTLKCGVGDVFRVMVWQNSGGSVNIGNGGTSVRNTDIQLTYLGPTSS